jgi:hypothetical protein
MTSLDVESARAPVVASPCCFREDLLLQRGALAFLGSPAAHAPVASSERSNRIQWTRQGFSTLMLIGVACAPLAPSSHTSVEQPSLRVPDFAAASFMPSVSLPGVQRNQASQGLSPVMIGDTSRREALQQSAGVVLAALAAMQPRAAQADGASSKITMEKARAIYGSRVARLVGASNEKIVEERSMFTLFTTGSYRATGGADKAKRKELKKLGDAAVKAAAVGEGDAAQDAVKAFIKSANIKSTDQDELSIYNPKQRRSAGSPTTDSVLAQMGPMKGALYQPLGEYKPDPKPKTK